MPNAVYNPKNKPVESLPLIMGFINGSFGRDVVGQLLAETGEALGSHISSHEGYLYGDLGITEGSRPDRHETFRTVFPDGYRMEFVKSTDPRLTKAIEANAKLRDEVKNLGSKQDAPSRSR